MSEFDFDAVVLGGGSAGYAAARMLSAGGARTAVVEGSPELGGLCILRGCMPTKALLRGAELRHSIRDAAEWGIYPGPVRIDFARLMARKDELIANFAEHRQKQLQDGRFELFRSPGRLSDARTVELGNGKRLRAPYIVLATGSTVPAPPISGLREAGYLTSDDALRLKELPESVVVLGGGPVALEFAQFFSRLGTRVAILQRGPHILRDSDPEMAAELEKALRREGIELFTDTRIERVEVGSGGRNVLFKHQGTPRQIEADQIFHGLGRVPNIAGLGLESADITLENGRIRIDSNQRTTRSGIYAAGDCCGPHEVVHIAITQGEIAAHNILNPQKLRELETRLLLSVVFTEPQVAQVGLTETMARAAGRDVAVATYPFNDHGKSMILGCKEGLVKLIADRVTGEILGGSCVGPQGGELIHEIMIAMAARMTAAQLAALPHYHPTLAEIWTYPAEELAGG
ncbi:MAG: NAD(P)/FAD-dependent oxidoreductase [Pedosphaera sp.]|nr:NAD(P)/FAD-dependent oxidoreductase [Pedosphaera sp.]